MTTRKALAIAAAIAFFGAFIPTLVVLRMMADNNNNGEIYDTVTGLWKTDYVVGVFAIFYVASFFLILAVAFALARLWSADAS